MEFNLKKKLTRREQYAVYTAGCVVLGFLLLHFMIFPLMENRKRLDNSLAIKTRTLQEMQNLKSEYEALSGQSGLSGINLSQREKGFTLFSFLDKLSGQAGIKDHITYMKPAGWLDNHTLLIETRASDWGSVVLVRADLSQGTLSFFCDGAFAGFVYP